VRRKPASRAPRGAVRRGTAGSHAAPGEARAFARRRVLIVECLDAHGAIPEDAAARARALEPLAGVVETLVVDLRPDGAGSTHGAGQPGVPRAQIERAVERLQPGLVIVAAASPETCAVGRLVEGSIEVHGWTTALDAAPRRSARRPGSGGRFSLLNGSDGEEEPSFVGRAGFHPEGVAALDWAVHDAGDRGRASMPLWDGRYLLAPAPLAGGAGHDLLRAFATLDARWDRVELVVLAPVQSEFRDAARKLGVGARVHFAGAATPDAELTWLRAASGVVLAHPGPLAASLVLRTLSCGAPVLSFGAGIAPRVHGWLADRGAVPVSWTSDLLPARAKLEHLLERDRAVEHAIERGRFVASSHAAEVLAARLGAALALEPRRTRAA